MLYKYYGKYKEMFEDSKGVNRRHKWKDTQQNGQTNKDRRTKHYTEN